MELIINLAALGTATLKILFAIPVLGVFGFAQHIWPHAREKDKTLVSTPGP